MMTNPFVFIFLLLTVWLWLPLLIVGFAMLLPFALIFAVLYALITFISED